MEPITQSPRHLVLAGLASVTAAVTAAWWWLIPGWNHFADPDDALLRQWLDPGQTAAVMLAVGLLGTVLAGAGLRFPTTRRRLAAPAAALAVGAFGLLGMGAIATTGYLVALLAPFALLLVIVQLVRLGGTARWLALGAPLAVLGLLAATGVLTREALPVLVRVPRLLLDQIGVVASEFLLVGLVAAWVVTAARGGGGALGAWVLRHRPVITLLAALGPLPYALVRLTWLTPWPALAPTDDLPAEMRLWGVMLSVGAWAGVVLTIGLIRPWGEVFPRWVPFAGGRPVPVWFAAAPAALVATTVTAAAVPFALAGLDSWMSLVDVLVILPFWYWGPLLGLATWGYVLHRSAPGPAVEGRAPVRAGA